MIEIRFYLDEHVPAAIGTALRLKGVDTLTVQEAGMAGATDEEQLNFALQMGRVMFTRDRDYLRLDREGHAHAGIVFSPRDATIGRIVEELTLIAHVMSAEEMVGRVTFI